MGAKLNTNKALELLKEKMLENGIGNWIAKLDRCKVRFGSCCYDSKTITLSKSLVDVNSEERVLMTILHEIAHALCPIGERHSQVWKYKCLSIGGNGRARYTTDNTNTPKGNWIAKCPVCNEYVYMFRKMNNGNLTCL